MYCNACGAEIPVEARYCGQCGRAAPGPGIRGKRIPLERPRRGRKIAGVCLGLANSLDVDVTLVRVLWVVFTLLFAIAFGVVAYIVAWILMPEEPAPVTAALRVP